MKVLVLCEDYWHPARVPREGLGTLSDVEFSFDWVENTQEWSAETMSAYPLVILAKANHVSAADQTHWMSESVESVFSDYVRKGNGLLATHSGTVGYDQTRVLRRLLGGVFSHHPKQCLVTMEPKMAHPLCFGIESVTIRDEHYFMALDDPRADVFMTTKSMHGEQPGAWRRFEGAGRVAVLTPGHNLEVWLHSSFQALLRNALRWCGKLL